ncbi:Dolichol-phosphate mannosyltransferase subunit 3 [Pseudolycoriella hygida]|uniref:Dolichol-phosphate mannosyltransferase subunit 3 n=1 Tax=Pseudolycoriella hygida TaxID=35572 RepID=A0A9Q0MYB3_9DIPT|nr:Dolichol-phosphate mannosyltransferase subunit 3 [Pseudolycoriella hygida]
MTKLMEWVFVLSLFFAAYIAIVTKQIQSDVFDNWMFEVKVAPVILVLLFGVYAASTVLYRVFTFNDCPEAAEELQRQIKEAREDLMSRGFRFIESN